jgi:hypothetical protein
MCLHYPSNAYPSIRIAAICKMHSIGQYGLSAAVRRICIHSITPKTPRMAVMRDQAGHDAVRAYGRFQNKGLVPALIWTMPRTGRY